MLRGADLASCATWPSTTLFWLFSALQILSSARKYLKGIQIHEYNFEEGLLDSVRVGWLLRSCSGLRYRGRRLHPLVVKSLPPDRQLCAHTAAGGCHPPPLWTCPLPQGSSAERTATQTVVWHKKLSEKPDLNKDRTLLTLMHIITS